MREREGRGEGSLVILSEEGGKDPKGSLDWCVASHEPSRQLSIDEEEKGKKRVGSSK